MSFRFLGIRLGGTSNPEETDGQEVKKYTNSLSSFKILDLCEFRFLSFCVKEANLHQQVTTSTQDLGLD
jgi:hypothetical protein